MAFRQARVLAIGLTALTGALVLAGCQSSSTSPRSGLTTSSLASPKGVPVALESIEGVPDAMTGSVKQAIVAQASQRSMDVVSPGKPAQYRIKGYVTAYANDEGTSLSFVWDVFDASQKRARRVTATMTTAVKGEDAWSRVDEQQLAMVSRKGIDELAAFLATKAGEHRGGAEEAMPGEPNLGPTGGALAYSP